MDRHAAAIDAEEGRSRLAALYGACDADSQAARYAALRDKARALFGPAPGLCVSAPGRTELGGNHTDHNGGKVLAASVNLDTAMRVSPNGTMTARLRSEGYPDEIEVDLRSLEPVPEERGSAASLVRGVAAALAAKGRAIGGFDAVATSTVIPGSGLSSSASFEVAVGTALSWLFSGGEVPWVELALAGKEAENRFFGKPCGLMDQMACASGGAIAIDFREPAEPRWTRLRFDPAAAGFALYVVDTRGSHADLTEDYASVPSDMRAAADVLGRETLAGTSRAEIVGAVADIRSIAGDRAWLRAYHFATENERVDGMKEALASADTEGFLGLVRASGLSSWTLLQNLYSPRKAGRELCVALALAEDLLGGRGACRVHGGGFAGTVQAYVPADLETAFVRGMEACFGAGCATRLSIRAEGACKVFAD